MEVGVGADTKSGSASPDAVGVRLGRRTPKWGCGTCLSPTLAFSSPRHVPQRFRAGSREFHIIFRYIPE